MNTDDAAVEAARIPLEHDKRCACTNPAQHRLVWTNWKLVQAEAALKDKYQDGYADGLTFARSQERQHFHDACEWTQAASAGARRQVESVLTVHYGAVHACAVEDLVEILGGNST